jgi:hypothetical protein
MSNQTPSDGICESRRASRRTIGAFSCSQSMPTYRFLSSYSTRTVVGSLGGAPSSGKCCTNPPDGAAVAHTASSRRPSMTGGWGVRVAVMWGRGDNAVGTTGRAWANTNARAAMGAGDTDRRHCITASMATTDRLVERLAELISFDTRNPDGDERPLVHRLGAELRALGAASVEEVDGRRPRLRLRALRRRIRAWC